MSWFGKSLVVLNTIVSLILLGAIAWMVIEQREFEAERQKRQSEINKQREQWINVTKTLAGLLEEQREGNRSFVWTERVEDKRTVPQEVIKVAEARRRVQELEHGGTNMPSLADLAAQLKKIYDESTLERDKLDKAQQETRALGEQLAQVTAAAVQLQPAPGKPGPVEELQQQQREIELKMRDLELPLNLARLQRQVLAFRKTQLSNRLRELQRLLQLPSLSAQQD
jgi:hypothetical protein